MLGEMGRRADAAVRRGTDAVGETVHVTVLHVRRIAGAVTLAASRVTREARDMVWDYQDVAADLRRPADKAPHHDEHHEVDTQEEPARPVLRVVGSDE